MQLYPCDYPNAPKSVHAQRYPCVIEYSLDTSKVQNDKNLDWKEHILDQANSIRRLLSAITNHHFFEQDAVLKSGVWGIPKDISPDLDEAFRSIWVEELYMWPEIGEEMYATYDRRISESVHRLAPVMPVVTDDGSHHYYFDGNRKGWSDEVVFPECTSAVFLAYESLDANTRQKIDAITQLIDNGLALIGRMKSLSFLSFVSAIEAMVALEYTELPEKCESCGQEKFRVVYKFTSFLKKYIDGDKAVAENKKLFISIYKRRSEIAHKGALLLGDAHQHWKSTSEQEEQFRLHLMTMQFARLSLVNWLLSHQSTDVS